MITYSDHFRSIFDVPVVRRGGGPCVLYKMVGKAKDEAYLVTIGQ